MGYDSFAHPKPWTPLTTMLSRPSPSTNTCALPVVDRPDLIMLDIEGAEYRALKGAQSFLQQPAGQAPNIVFEAHRHYVDWSNGLENTELIRFLTDLGYQVFAVRDFNSNYNLVGKPIEIIPAKDVYLEGPDHGFNMVAGQGRQRVRQPGLPHLPWPQPQALAP